MIKGIILNAKDRELVCKILKYYDEELKSYGTIRSHVRYKVINPCGVKFFTLEELSFLEDCLSLYLEDTHNYLRNHVHMGLLQARMSMHFLHDRVYNLYCVNSKV